MNLSVKKLSEFLYEGKFPAKSRTEIWFNVLEIYNLPFERDTVENLFESIEELVGENWENYHTQGSFYAIVEPKEDEIIFCTTPAPKTISDFIEDCIRLWGYTPLWDGNLVKRYFKYIP